jgi:hypothetical protein
MQPLSELLADSTFAPLPSFELIDFIQWNNNIIKFRAHIQSFLVFFGSVKWIQESHGGVAPVTKDANFRKFKAA